jgi:protocatechuate 3,4-dioxygenase beta subunit
MSRREVLALFGAAGAALIVGCSDDENGSTATATSSGGQPTAGSTQAATATVASAQSTTTVPACVVIPELTEGPYFVDEMLERSDIRSDPSDNSVSEGDELGITVNVSQIGGDGSCTPLADAQVDVWHCDALGVYSDVADPSFDTSGRRFLRGYQNTDRNGAARFVTIYPGWYPGRATHIHFKIRTDNGYAFTSQWFFDDAFSDTVHAQGAYASKGVSGRLQNSSDNIFQSSNGLLTLDVQQSGSMYAATFDIGLQIA